MSQRNYNNVTSLGSLSGPVAASATSLPTTAFTGYPAVPFTITVDRNTATEEICLVTGISGANLTVTRGFDGTAGQAHSAGATIEHTTGAIDFAEANSHVNATSGVHGVTGSLVGAQGAQSIYDKTLISPVAQADVTAGDAVVAYVPPAASARNLFRGIGTAGTDVMVITSAGALSTAGVTSTAALHAQGNTQLDGTLTVNGASTLTGAVNAPGGITSTTGAFSGAVSGTTATFSGASTAPSYTSTGLVKGAGLESTQALQLAQIASPAGTASKNTLYAKTDGGLYAKVNTNAESRLPTFWGTVTTTYPSTALLGDTVYRSDMLAMFTYQGSAWIQTTMPNVTNNGTRNSQYATPANIPVGFRIWHIGLNTEQIWDGSAWRFTISGRLDGVTSDGSGLYSFAHNAGQAPIDWSATMPNQPTDGIALVLKLLEWTQDATNLTVRTVRTDTTAFFSTAFNVKWRARF